MVHSLDTLSKYRELAENTQMISALGEYTPEEFTELLDSIVELKKLLKLSNDFIINMVECGYLDLSEEVVGIVRNNNFATK